jgi:hypothetical protein
LVAQAHQNATILLTITDDGGFTWAFAAPGEPPTTFRGTYNLADGVATLAGKDVPGGALVGQVLSRMTHT